MPEDYGKWVLSIKEVLVLLLLVLTGIGGYLLVFSLFQLAGTLTVNGSVYFSGTNLLTWANYTMADPEVNAYGTRGWETPFGKTYTFGLELSF